MRAEVYHRNTSKDVRFIIKMTGTQFPNGIAIDIVRILFMVPIYSIVSFASYLFWVSIKPLYPDKV